MANHIHRQALPIRDKLKFAMMLSGLMLVVEVVGGLVSNSLALLSDAGHVLADVIALALSWYGVRQAERPSSGRMTFGYHRVGVMIAMVNAIAIFAIAGFVFYAAYRRLLMPPEVNSQLMLAVAIVGLAVNLFIAFWLRREQHTSLNVRSAFWHVLGDALASVGVIIGGVIILVSGWFIVDPIVSLLIGFIIILSAWRILKEGLSVLLEATPHQIDVAAMLHALNQMPGVKDVHDVHVWSISPEIPMMSGHVLIDDVPISQAASLRQKIEDVLRQDFDIKHTALQFECEECGCNGVFCKLTFESIDEGAKKPRQE